MDLGPNVVRMMSATACEENIIEHGILLNSEVHYSQIANCGLHKNQFAQHEQTNGSTTNVLFHSSTKLIELHSLRPRDH